MASTRSTPPIPPLYCLMLSGWFRSTNFFSTLFHLLALTRGSSPNWFEHMYTGLLSFQQVTEISSWYVDSIWPRAQFFSTSFFFVIGIGYILFVFNVPVPPIPENKAKHVRMLTISVSDHIFANCFKVFKEKKTVLYGERCIALSLLVLSYYRIFLGTDLENKDSLWIYRLMIHFWNRLCILITLMYKLYIICQPFLH